MGISLNGDFYQLSHLTMPMTFLTEALEKHLVYSANKLMWEGQTFLSDVAIIPDTMLNSLGFSIAGHMSLRKMNPLSYNKSENYKL